MGEAHRSLTILTRKYGLVRAFARSSREERSKLRYSIQLLALSDFSLVRGKEGWRVVGAVGQALFSKSLGGERKKLILAGRLCFLLSRLVGVEESNERLFLLLKDVLYFVERHQLSDDALKNSEHFFVLNMLHELGFLRPHPSLDRFVDTPRVSASLLSEFSPFRRQAAVLINEALKESQL